MTAIKEFKQLYMLETYSGKAFVLEASKIEMLDKLIETAKFVNISGARINVSNISGYYPIPSNGMYDFIVACPETIRSMALKMMQHMEKDNNKDHLCKFDLPTLRRKLGNKLKIPRNNSSEDQNATEYMIEYLHINYPNNA